MTTTAGLPRFRNEPTLELRRAANRDALLAALAQLDGELPVRCALRAGPDRREGDDLASFDPGTPERVVALAPSATAADVDAAVAAATRAAPAWAATPAADRAAVLVAAAAWMRERRHRLAALCVRECAKPWAEADGDVCEAIDFLEFYARGAIALDHGPALFQVPGEQNTMRYRARGVAAVISPWNFPIAIPTGMTAAALATGNAAVLKPAEQSPGCGEMIARALEAAGLPDGVLGVVPGDGEAGAALVRHPGVHTIAFTGSNAVGLEIAARAGEVLDGQRHLKRCVIEMGGKNCVIVDSDADLDEVVPGIVSSAFAYAGQKCSAAARILVHEAIAEQLAERLAGAIAVLEVGQAETFGTDVPPVIEAEARDRIDRYRALAAGVGTLQPGPLPAVPADGWFCPPALATGLPDDSPVLGDEVFGPLISLEAVRSIDDACDRVDALRFALTGGLYARNPHTVERVIARSPVGNLYVNRPITGAMVGRQPFGGNRLSGTGTKAGGPDYLLQFVEPQVVTENTVRHGLLV